MIHQREGLAFGLEAGDDIPRVHSRFNDLQRDTPANGFSLLRKVNNSTAALADFLNDLITANPLPGRIIEFRSGTHLPIGGQGDWVSSEESVGSINALDHGFEASGHCAIVAPQCLQKSPLVVWGEFQRLLEEAFQTINRSLHDISLQVPVRIFLWATDNFLKLIFLARARSKARLWRTTRFAARFFQKRPVF